LKDVVLIVDKLKKKGILPKKEPLVVASPKRGWQVFS